MAQKDRERGGEGDGGGSREAKKKNVCSTKIIFIIRGVIKK